VIERSLHHIENLMLYHSRLIADGDDDISFCELTHDKNKSLADTGMRGRNCEKSRKSYAKKGFPEER
jgi:hypothetical protein